MFHNRSAENRVNRLCAQQIMTISTFEELFLKDKFFSIDHQNIRNLENLPAFTEKLKKKKLILGSNGYVNHV